MTDADDLDRRVSVELQRHIDASHTVTLFMYTPEAFALVGLIQLACRHPHVGRFARQVAEQLVGQIAVSFEGDAAITEAIRRGWHDDSRE